jgi:hypothetical protein
MRIGINNWTIVPSKIKAGCKVASQTEQIKMIFLKRHQTT